jgi:hypothetical protein
MLARMLRLLCSTLVLALIQGASLVAAQDAPPELESELGPEPEPASGSTPAPEPRDDAAPAPAPSAPAPAPAPGPAPARAPAPRFEGQVSDDGAYESEPGGDDDDPYEGNRSKGSGFTMPAFSIRLDPFNWLIEGRLGIELEVAIWEFISFEMVPVFVANSEPPSFNFVGRDDPISQHSNGLGPIAGTSLGAGFWLSGKPLQGYVLRAIFTNYGFTYEARDRSGRFDRVDFTERRIVAFFGSHSRFGFFTISGGLGLGYDLNQQQRCFDDRGTTRVTAKTSGCADSGEQQILLDRVGRAVADLNGGFHPIYLEGRFSVGAVFD